MRLFLWLLALLFIGLKLGGAIAWSWWLVLSPIGLAFLLGLFVFAVAVLAEIAKELRKS